MDNYSKVYIKTFGSSPFNGNFIHPGGQDYQKWKISIDVATNKNDSNFKSKGPTQIKLNVGTSSQPQTNLPNGVNAPESNQIYNRSSRGLSSVYNYTGSYTRPAIIGRYNGIYTSARGRSGGKSGPLNPIKHWRKQLIPSQGHITGKPSLNHVIWNPGSATTLSSDIDTSCCGITSNPNSGMLFSYLNNGFVDNSNCNCNGENSVIRNQLSNYQPVIFNNPERITRPKSSQTILKKNYYTTGTAYLRSRAKLFEQNQLLSNVQHKNGSNQLVMRNQEQVNQRLPPANNNWVYAESDLRKGSQAFNSTYCITDPSACCGIDNNSASGNGNMQYCRTPVTYKPSNPFYAVQGAVDSSTRILQAKYSAITKNNYELSLGSLPDNQNTEGIGLNVKSVAGDNNSSVITLPGSTPSKYRGESYRGVSPYFIKSKYQKISACSQQTLNLFNFQSSTHSRARLNGIGNRQPSGGTGNITTCFYNKIR